MHEIDTAKDFELLWFDVILHIESNDVIHSEKSISRWWEYGGRKEGRKREEGNLPVNAEHN